MRASPDAAAELEALDEAILKLVVLQGAQIFGKPVSAEEARSRYVPALKRSEKGYEPTWKCKINVGGKGQVAVWDAQRQRRGFPQSWLRARVVLKVTLKSLWIMGKQFGPLFEASDILLEEAVQECPF